MRREGGREVGEGGREEGDRGGIVVYLPKLFSH